MQEEARKIIQELDLLKLFNKYGDARIVGSVATDLIVKPDIDIHVLIDNNQLMEVINETYVLLLNYQEVKEVRITDYRFMDSMKIGIDSYPGETIDWSIDIWVTGEFEKTGFEMVQYIKDNLNTDNKKAILELKEYYYQKGLLENGMSSRIYNAVIDHGVKNIHQFKEYLRN